MAKNAHQKTKLLHLAQILETESDEAHPITTSALIAALAQRDIPVERKTLYADIEQLCRFGMDIVTVRGRHNAYYLGQRSFELPELKLLVDAVESAKFITAEKSRRLIQKLCSLTSRHEGRLMQRQVQVSDRAKTVNQRTYYNVDALHNAMAENRQIRFRYYRWAVDKKAPRALAYHAQHSGRFYHTSPFSLVWDDEYYYLVAWDHHSNMVRHYRVDRMDEIALLDKPRAGGEKLGEKDLSAYSKSVFGMFGGQTHDVRLRFANHLIGVVVDRFGTDIFITPDDDEHFAVTLSVVVSPQFFAWLFGFGAEAELLGPTEVLEQLKDTLREVSALYPE